MVSLALSPHVYGIIVLSILYMYLRFDANQYILSVLFLSVFPFVPIFLDYLRDKVDIFISERERRTKYFALTALIYLLAALLFYLWGNFMLLILFLTYLAETVLHMLVNTRWKISIHAAGIAGPTTFLTVAVDGKLGLLYLLLLPVYAARKKMNAHSDMQLIGGVLLSSLTTLVIVEFLTSYIS